MMKLPANERRAYQRYLDDLSYQASMVESSYGIGRKEGKEEGREEATTAMARALKQQGVPFETISLASGLSIEAIRRRGRILSSWRSALNKLINGEYSNDE